MQCTLDVRWTLVSLFVVCDTKRRLDRSKTITWDLHLTRYGLRHKPLSSASHHIPTASHRNIFFLWNIIYVHRLNIMYSLLWNIIYVLLWHIFYVILWNIINALLWHIIYVLLWHNLCTSSKYNLCTSWTTATRDIKVSYLMHLLQFYFKNGKCLMQYI